MLSCRHHGRDMYRLCQWECDSAELCVRVSACVADKKHTATHLKLCTQTAHPPNLALTYTLIHTQTDRPCRAEHPNHPHTVTDMRSRHMKPDTMQHIDRDADPAWHRHAHYTHTHTHNHCQRLFRVTRQTLTCHKWKWREASTEGKKCIHTLICAHSYTHIKNTPTY